MTVVHVVWNEAIDTPLVTLWVFLIQVLIADNSCRSSVARLIAHRIWQEQRSCSSETGAHCQARKRLSERFFAVVACQFRRAFDSHVAHNCFWRGLQILMLDGTTVFIPDTQGNMEVHTKTYNQNAVQEFALTRVGSRALDFKQQHQ